MNQLQSMLDHDKVIPMCSLVTPPILDSFEDF